MPEKNTSAVFAATAPTLFNRNPDWRDVYAVAIKSVRQSLVALSADESFEDISDASFVTVQAAIDLLDQLQKERPAAEDDTINWPLYKVKTVLMGARAMLGNVDSYPQRALDRCINNIESAAGLAMDLQDEAERVARETQERTERARKAAEAEPEGGAHNAKRKPCAISTTTSI